MRWLVPNQRVTNRHVMPPLRVYLGQVRTSRDFEVGDVSIGGFYMLTEERWIVGTGFPVTLERLDAAGYGKTLTVFATVVRNGDDGVGFSFHNQLTENEQRSDVYSKTRLDLSKLAEFLKGLPLSEPGPDSLERAS